MRYGMSGIGASQTCSKTQRTSGYRGGADELCSQRLLPVTHLLTLSFYRQKSRPDLPSRVCFWNNTLYFPCLSRKFACGETGSRLTGSSATKLIDFASKHRFALAPEFLRYVRRVRTIHHNGRVTRRKIAVLRAQRGLVSLRPFFGPSDVEHCGGIGAASGRPKLEVLTWRKCGLD